MKMKPGNEFGYLCLTLDTETDRIFIKANKISAIEDVCEESRKISNKLKTVVYIGEGEGEWVSETSLEIFEQLGNIHPAMR